MVVLVAVVWPFEIAVYLWPVGMAQVLDGTIDDGFDGLLGWTWLVCAVTTIALLVRHLVGACASASTRR